jgi:phytanoyl-CoA hydroxylase
LNEEETKDAFNTNMMSGGLLSELPLDFARENKRSWLCAEYEAGDVVLHKPHMVRLEKLTDQTYETEDGINMEVSFRFMRRQLTTIPRKSFVWQLI